MSQQGQGSLVVQSGPARTANARANRGKDHSSCSQGLHGRRTQVRSNVRLNAKRVTTRTIMVQSSTARSLIEQSATVFVLGLHDLVCERSIDRRVEESKSRSSH